MDNTRRSARKGSTALLSSTHLQALGGTGKARLLIRAACKGQRAAGQRHHGSLWRQRARGGCEAGAANEEGRRLCAPANAPCWIACRARRARWDGIQRARQHRSQAKPDASQPASQSASQPATYPASHVPSQPAGQPASQPASAATAHAALPSVLIAARRQRRRHVPPVPHNVHDLVVRHGQYFLQVQDVFGVFYTLGNEGPRGSTSSRAGRNAWAEGGQARPQRAGRHGRWAAPRSGCPSWPGCASSPPCVVAVRRLRVPFLEQAGPPL